MAVELRDGEKREEKKKKKKREEEQEESLFLGFPVSNT